MTHPIDSPLLARIREVYSPLVEHFRRVIPSIQRLLETIRAHMNTEVVVSGLCSRYWVRAGLDPAYAQPGQLNHLVKAILAGREEDTAFLTPVNRSMVAAAAISGWSASYAGADPVGPLAWHRALGSTHFQLGAAS